MIFSLLILQISVMLMVTFLMLMQTRIMNLIVLLIVQNIVLTSYFLSKAWVQPDLALLLSLILTFIIKVIVFPTLLWRLVPYLNLTQRMEPLVNRPTLQLVGLALVTLICLLSAQIEPVIGEQAIVGFSLSLANCALALLLIVCRRKTISQVIGLLVMENSIFLLSATLTNGFPWLIELGMSFDVLIGFMIFGLFLLRIRSTHGSLHQQHLESLKE